MEEFQAIHRRIQPHTQQRWYTRCIQPDAHQTSCCHQNSSYSQGTHSQTTHTHAQHGTLDNTQYTSIKTHPLIKRFLSWTTTQLIYTLKTPSPCSHVPQGPPSRRFLANTTQTDPEPPSQRSSDVPKLKNAHNRANNTPISSSKHT